MRDEPTQAPPASPPLPWGAVGILTITAEAEVIKATQRESADDDEEEVE